MTSIIFTTSMYMICGGLVHAQVPSVAPILVPSVPVTPTGQVPPQLPPVPEFVLTAHPTGSSRPTTTSSSGSSSPTMIMTMTTTTVENSPSPSTATTSSLAPHHGVDLNTCLEQQNAWEACSIVEEATSSCRTCVAPIITNNTATARQVACSCPPVPDCWQQGQNCTVCQAEGWDWLLCQSNCSTTECPTPALLTTTSGANRWQPWLMLWMLLSIWLLLSVLRD